MQAITTKYLPVTNTKCSRVKAVSWLSNTTISWDYGLNAEDNHKAAIEKLIGDMNLARAAKGNSGSWKLIAIGSNPDQSGYTGIIDLDF